MTSSSAVSPSPRGLPLPDYVEYVGLTLEFLQSLQLSEQHMGDGTPYVRIPYLQPDGTVACVRQRHALTGDDRFRWRTGDKTYPYGAWRLDRAREAGYLVVCEGETDSQVLWYHDIPALGVPGAATWKSDWDVLLDGIEKIFVLIEPDSGGDAMLRWVEGLR